MGDGDGWVRCTDGHRHWGRFGAAGLLLSDTDSVVLQHRSARTHEGGTWALPGGARDSHEDPVQTALREAGEEAGIAADSVRPTGLACVDHGGWSYTTVLARPLGVVRPFAANWESDEVRWWPVDEVDELDLHPGFAAAWPVLRPYGRPVHIIVDGANVVGSRPDGWWRDRPAATARLHDGLRTLVRAGLAVEDLPAHLTSPALTRVLPLITLVVEGTARTLADDAAAATADWWLPAITVVPADGSGDDAVVDQARTAVTGEPSAASVLVVTADRGLRVRLPEPVTTLGPAWLWERIDAVHSLDGSPR